MIVYKIYNGKFYKFEKEDDETHETFNKKINFIIKKNPKNLDEIKKLYVESKIKLNEKLLGCSYN